MENQQVKRLIKRDDLGLQEINGDLIPDSQPSGVNYYVMPAEGGIPPAVGGRSSSSKGSNLEDFDQECRKLQEHWQAAPLQRTRHLMELPRDPSPQCRCCGHKPIIEYSKSIIMTFDAYISQMEEKARQGEEAAKEREQRKLEIQHKKVEREVQRIQREG
jgi:hypothetical protein